MNVLFIFPTLKGMVDLHFQHGIANISSVLKKANHCTRLLVLDSIDKQEIDNVIEEFSPEVIGLSVTSFQFEFTKDIVKYLYEKYPKIKIILGGPHPTICPEESIKLEGVSGICVGEGEYPLLELVTALENNKPYRGIKNLWFKEDKKIIKNEIRELIQDLDSLPMEDRELFDFQKMIDKRTNHRVEIMATRGCPFNCSYCINHRLSKIYSGKGRYVRFRSPENVIQEMQNILSAYKNVERFTFHDDTFTLDKQWLRKFLILYKGKINLPYTCNGRIHCFDEEIAKLLKWSGCTTVGFGIETGNPHLRNNILKRNMTDEHILTTFKAAKKHRLRTHAFNMIGIPFETEKTIKETIKLNRKTKTDEMFVSIFRPLPGTDIYDLCKKKGFELEESKSHSYFANTYSLIQPTIDKKTIEYYFRMFRWKVQYPLLSLFVSPLVRMKFKKKSIYDWVLLPITYRTLIWGEKLRYWLFRK